MKVWDSFALTGDSEENCLLSFEVLRDLGVFTVFLAYLLIVP